MAKNKYAATFALIKHIQQFDPEYTSVEAVRAFTDGKHTSLRDVADNQIYYLNQMLQQVAATPSKPKENAYAADPRDKQRKAIIAIFRSNGKTVQDAKAFCETNGVFGVKRGFNEYSGQELFQLARISEKLFRP